ncbi:rhodanese-like domain-containing protein [Desulfonema limicola]|uniref:rhodanese-like domain-containing protein n=1 Tax=Desulfonema limicola TaxID=45656 RepID=UPI001A9AE80A|nr:rhodanese-like domain-containing protein [Desulfonema limicola]
MSWKDFFIMSDNMTAQDAKEYMDKHEQGSYTLLDVRQPGEYEHNHIPGSKLIPLPQLLDRIDELDPEKPVITY